MPVIFHCACGETFTHVDPLVAHAGTEHGGTTRFTSQFVPHTRDMGTRRYRCTRCARSVETRDAGLAETALCDRCRATPLA